MNYKVTFAVSAALLGITTTAWSIDNNTKVIEPTSINKPTRTLINLDHGEIDSLSQYKTQRYIVTLTQPAIAQYRGEISGFAATQPVLAQRTNKSQRLHNLQANAVTRYRNYLQSEQTKLINHLQQEIGIGQPSRNLQYALNAFIIEATPAQAAKIAATSGVESVEADRVVQIQTDAGPELIGSPAIWNGNALQSGIPSKGEGTVVAILDTGINTDHRSFAATGDDGYTHTNPLGNGVYLGDCAAGYPALCNDKLIGVYSYPLIVNTYSDTSVYPAGLPKNGEDYNGHGSHVASTAAGNILYDVPEVGLDFDQAVSDGIIGEYQFPQISGVAPHANIISYQVCLPGEDGDEYSGCYASLAVSAVEDAIASGVVDAINYSISGGGDPWSGATNEAWLSANDAGIFVAHSAGNSGSQSFTTEKSAPWITAVAATTHGRTVTHDKTISDFSGGTTSLSSISGVSNSGAITASIVYAGDYPNPNDPGGDYAQCLEPYPTGTFNGEIVVCDRGDIARVAKASNVAAGGAGGFVLANIDPSSGLNSDAYALPGIHISSTNGTILKNWLAAGSGHTATISASSGVRSIDSNEVDNVASFSSRGPNSDISTLTPMVGAPGVSIYAAYSDEHYGHEETGAAPADFAYLDGTSMASPHVAGAAALIKQVHPSWSPDAIRSAMMMTAKTSLSREEDNMPANWFDMGSGRIQINKAVQSGLVIEETKANYNLADPANNNLDVRNLNLPAIVDDNCLIVCEWQRSVTATQDGSWSVSADDMGSGLDVTVTPATFTLAEGESQVITFSINTWNAADNAWSYGKVNLTSANSPDLHIPLAINASNGNFPDEIEITAHRNADSFVLDDLEAMEITDFTYSVHGLISPTVVSDTIAEDSDGFDFLDDLNDGVHTTELNIGDNALSIRASITESSAQDLDLFLVFDANENGTPEESEIIDLGVSASFTETVSVLSPDAGTYWLFVQNFRGSFSATDNFTLEYAIVTDTDEGNLIVSGPSNNGLLEPFSLRFIWDLFNVGEGDSLYGAVTMGTSAEEPDNLGVISVVLNRDEDDVSVSSSSRERVAPGDIIDYSVDVIANTTNEDRNYEISVDVPAGTSLKADSVTDGGTVSGNTISWSIVQSVTEVILEYSLTTSETNDSCSLGVNNRYIDLDQFALSPINSKQRSTAVSYPIGVTFLDRTYHSVLVSDDGFITVGAQSFGATPWQQQPLADQKSPNNTIAPLWHDWEFANQEDSGIVAATVNNGAQSVIEWRNMVDSKGNQVSFQLIFNNYPNINQPDIVFAYKNMTVTEASLLNNVSAGYENGSGTDGKVAFYRDGSGRKAAITSDSNLICLTRNQTENIGAASVDFSVQVNADTVNPGPISVVAVSRVPNIIGTQQEPSQVYTGVQIQGPPNVLIDDSKNATLDMFELSDLVLPATATDPNDDTLSYRWSQLSGESVTISDPFTLQPTITAFAVDSAQQVELALEVYDGYGGTDTANVVVTINNNTAPVLSISAPDSVVEGSTITISASATDAENDDITFTINEVVGATYRSTAPSTDSQTTVTFTVTASDGINEVTDTVSVTITDKPSSGGGSTSIWLLLLLPVLGWRYRR